MEENNINSNESSTMDKMRELIEKKKQKSASQGSVKRGPEDRFGTTPQGNKKHKTGGLSPK